MSKYKTTGKQTLFDAENAAQKLSEIGNTLEKLDSAYVGQEETLRKYELKDEICEKGYRGKPLTDEQREENRKKSTIRSRVEHFFGFMEGAMHGLTVRTTGIARATTHIFLKCLTYNLFRYEQFVRNGIR